MRPWLKWTCAGIALLLRLRAAAADPSEPAQLARGIRVEVSSGDAMVSRGAVRVPLLHTPVFGFSVSGDATEVEFDLDDCWQFGEPEQATFTLDMLEARLENAAALKLHRAGQYQEAALGFQQALRLDPGYLLAGLNLASALNRAGQREKGAAALLPFLPQHVAKVYLAALQDPELMPLLDQPSLVALRARPRGTAALKSWSPDWIAYSQKHGRLAVLDPHDGLRVFSLNQGQLDAAVELGERVPRWSGDGDASRAAQKAAKQLEKRAKVTLARKLPMLNRFLADLGFVEVTRRELGKLAGDPGSYQDVVFPGSGMKLVFDSDSELRLVSQQHTLARGDGLEGNRLVKVILLPGLNTLVWQWSRNHGPTDCHRQAGTEVMFPSPSAPAR